MEILLGIGCFLFGCLLGHLFTRPVKGGYLVKVRREGQKTLWSFEMDNLESIEKKDKGYVNLKIVTKEQREENMPLYGTENGKEK